MIEFEDACKFELTFGKYKGRTIYAVYKFDPSYIEWLSENSYGKTQEAVEIFLYEIDELDK